MKATNSSSNIDHRNYRTVIIPLESVSTVKQKLGDEFTWRYDEQSNQAYLMEKSKVDTGFSTEFAKDLPEIAYEWYNGELVNKWDD